MRVLKVIPKCVVLGGKETLYISHNDFNKAMSKCPVMFIERKVLNREGMELTFLNQVKRVFPVAQLEEIQ